MSINRGTIAKEFYELQNDLQGIQKALASGDTGKAKELEAQANKEFSLLSGQLKKAGVPENVITDLQNASTHMKELVEDGVGNPSAWNGAVFKPVSSAQKELDV